MARERSGSGPVSLSHLPYLHGLADRPAHLRILSQEARLQRVHGRHPGEVAWRKEEGAS